MRIALFNWRDLAHPNAGGAERSTDNLLCGLVERGHSATWFTSSVAGAAADETRNGYSVVRRGSELTCRLSAAQWLSENRATFDVIVDEVNTLPFLSPFITPGRVVLWIHQLAREIWFSEAPPVIGHCGYVSERWLLRPYKHVPTITVSNSSAQSLRAIGLKGPITVAENQLRPPAAISTKTKPGLVGYLGRLTPSKRIDHVIRAFALIKAKAIPYAELLIIGRGAVSELHRLQNLAIELGVDKFVTFSGAVNDEVRDSLLASLDVLAMASLREGWGLVVSEAARFGVPSVVYPVAGLVDSVRTGVTGLVTQEPTPQSLAEALINLIQDRALRNSFGQAAMSYISEFDQERFVGRFESVLRNSALSRGQ